jgi:hypothetical protein
MPEMVGGPEAVANAADPYMHGWMDAITEAGPELLEPMAVSASELLCAGESSDAEIIMFARMLIHAGERMSGMRAGMQCVLRRRTSEDVVMWAVLDAWSRARFAPTDEWRTWRERASDERTIRRFEPWDSRRLERPGYTEGGAE